MKSSQALAHSVFGTLKVMGNAAILQGLVTIDEGGLFPFEPDEQGLARIELEKEVLHLNEPRRTSIDVSFEGARRVAIECKLTEQDVGHCSKTRSNAADSEHCNGNYEIQQGRLSRCALTEIRVRYWDDIPALFHLDAGINHVPCSIRYTYQLVRNVLAACTLSGGLVVLLFDERNPAFQPDGAGYAAFTQVRGMLREPGKLQRCTWQELVRILRGDPELNWLTDHLKRKYGL